MSETQPLVKIEIDGAIALVTIDRPKALNALNSQLLSELDLLLTEQAGAGLSALVLTGAGDRAFAAGADIAEMQAMPPREARAFAETGAALGSALEMSTRPWIAAVHGFALGGGCELALACDFIYASKAAKFGQPEVKLGVIPGFGGTQRLARRVGIGKARELVYTGDTINAEEALRIGLVDRVVEQAELLPAARATAAKIAANGPIAIAEAKRVILEGADLPLEAACALEQRAFGELFSTADQREGMAAFLAKRPAAFKGE